MRGAVLALALSAPLAGAAVLGLASPARAGSHVAAETPAAPAEARAALLEKVRAMETQLAAIVTDLDAEILRQEDSAGFGASEEVLAQIDTLKARRDQFAEQLGQVRAMIAELEKAD